MSMLGDKKRKVVQTELDLEDYEALSNIAKSKSMTIKEAMKEALRSWTVGATNLADDPLFKLRPIEFKVKVKSDEIDAYLYKRRK